MSHASALVVLSGAHAAPAAAEEEEEAAAAHDQVMGYHGWAVRYVHVHA